ncbi:Aldo/keto reductase [Rhodofomes roseus]|uniref:Aldo/keto reductase n=1 Tax=Rhodofomes roseus TaxID=34475 RepID=A0ABQ8JZZ3_9APHY|nr:Aldo/keto reductase [Rhodofomes roseus]KAH9829966.1 Aldo/keto reductase [Rhodofomes roseus]
MSIGSPQWVPWVLQEDKALEVLKAAWDSGVNTIDTANAYSNGESERVIAKFIKQNNIPRENIVILDKIGFPVAPDVGTFTFGMFDGDTRDYVNRTGLSRAAIFNEVDASLRRLETTYIDLLQIHVFDSTVPIEETMKALHDLVSSGKVRYIGACNLRAWQLAEANHVAELHGWTQFTCVQVEHSLLYRPQEVEMFAYCAHKGIGVISYSPLMDGHLARPIETETFRTQNINGTPFEKKRRPSDHAIIKRVQELADKHDWSMAQVALAWSNTKVSSLIVGANSPDRLRGCITTGKTLTPEDIAYLEAPYEYQPYRY